MAAVFFVYGLASSTMTTISRTHFMRRIVPGDWTSRKEKSGGVACDQVFWWR